MIIHFCNLGLILILFLFPPAHSSLLQRKIPVLRITSWPSCDEVLKFEEFLRSPFQILETLLNRNNSIIPRVESIITIEFVIAINNKKLSTA
jgi:hypothetical protein